MINNRLKIVTNEDLKFEEIIVSTRVLVVGSGLVACKAARELSRLGHEVLVCSHETIPEFVVNDLKSDSGVELVAQSEILELEGSPGRFQVSFKTDNSRTQIEIGAVLLANEPLLKADFNAWEVEESEKIRSLSWLESALNSPGSESLSPEKGSLKVLFLCGFTHPSSPLTQERVIQTALNLSSNNKNQVFVVTEHFKVAHTGLERLTRQARETGVLFVKLTDTRPRLMAENGRLEISYYDDTLGEEVSINPDLLVLEESYEPPLEIRLLSERLGIHLDRNGFFQGENIYNQPIHTNRVGIWVAGSAKGPVSMEEGIEEAKAAALDVHHLLGDGKQQVAKNRIALDTKRCTICLTCYRLCPHRAISFMDRRPIFYDLACRACGICAAECPMDALQLHDFTDARIKSKIKDRVSDKTNAKGHPILVAFCCRNSAFEAAALATSRGNTLPEGLRMIRVPCAGKVDPDYLLTAFRAGADGVLVLGCHHESCKSVNGNELAEWRVETIKEYISEVGLEKERLFFGTLAPAMGSEFVKMVKEMQQTIRYLGNKTCNCSA